MNKRALVDKVAARTGVTKTDTRLMINEVFKVLSETLASGKEISYPGFGTLYVSEVSAHEAFNPLTGEHEQRAGRRKVLFRSAAELKRVLKA